MAKFTVKITSAKTYRVIGETNVIVPDERYERTFAGIGDEESEAILRAIKKLIGRNCGWHPNVHGCSTGQVTRPYHGGGTSLDELIHCDVETA